MGKSFFLIFFFLSFIFLIQNSKSSFLISSALNPNPNDQFYFSGEIPPHGKASITAEITPTRSGTKTLIVDIDTAEQKDFKGSADIYVGYSF